jgi:hypothetical protein
VISRYPAVQDTWALSLVAGIPGQSIGLNAEMSTIFEQLLYQEEA